MHKISILIAFAQMSLKMPWWRAARDASIDNIHIHMFCDISGKFNITLFYCIVLYFIVR